VLQNRQHLMKAVVIAGAGTLQKLVQLKLDTTRGRRIGESPHLGLELIPGQNEIRRTFLPSKSGCWWYHFFAMMTWRLSLNVYVYFRQDVHKN